MPQMGESIFEGTITKWLKKVGDKVEKDEPLFEISTDKVDAEIPAPVAGMLTEIRVPEGATVEINTVVAVIGGSGAAALRSSRQAQPQDPQPSHRRNSACTPPRRQLAVSRRPAHPFLAAGAAHRQREQPRSEPDRRHRLGRPHHQGRHSPLPEPARPQAAPVPAATQDRRRTAGCQASWCR